MKKCLLYVFSGTGNTLRVAGFYKEYLSPEYETEIVRVNFATVPYSDLRKKYDLIGFGYPVHAFNAPEVFVRFAKTLPAVNGTEAFIFESSGEGLHANDASSELLRKTLTKKGFDVLTDRHFVMPYNMITRHCDAMVKQMTAYARALARSNADELIAGKHEQQKKHPLLSLWSCILRIELLYAKIQGPAMRVNMKKCIQCGLCIRNCPLGNIRMENGKIKTGHNCALCVCCSFNCPADAFSIGLLNGWKVNGKYNFEKVVKDAALPFPFITDKTKGLYRIYRKYYRELDAKLEACGTSVLPEDFRA